MARILSGDTMIFLIDYKRDEGRLISIRSFKNSERDNAQDSRLELELDLHKNGVEREVVLLDAESEAVIRLTHGRYFYDLAELTARLKAQLLLT
jgi:hypothetical protein